jgi:hypothetical protein
MIQPWPSLNLIMCLWFIIGAFQVEQLGEAKILWLTQRFRTLLKVTEDARDPQKLTTSFALIRSVGIF